MRLLLCGYYGFGNLGDEWLLETMVHYGRTQGHQLTVLSHRPGQTSAAYGVPAISRWNPLRFLTQLRKNDLLLFGGGGLIQDRSSARSVFYYLAQIMAAKMIGKKVIMLGQGLGPLQGASARLFCELILPLVDLIVTRDAVSTQWCFDLGLEQERVVEAADLVWLKSFPINREDRKKNWVLCLRSTAPIAGEYLSKLHALAIKHDRVLVAIPFGDHGDEAWLERLKQRGALQGCRLARQEDYPHVFSQAEMVISMRYHALLLGAQTSALLLGMGDDPKVQSLMHDLGQLTATWENLPEKAVRLLSERNRYQEILQQRRLALIKKAGKNILSLQTFLLTHPA